MQELMTQEEILKMLSVEPLEIAEAERATAAPLYGKIPFSRLAALGVGLDAVVPALQQLMSGGKAMRGYYKVTIPAGTELARFHDGSGYLGTVLDNGIAGQARLNPVFFSQRCCLQRRLLPAWTRSWMLFWRHSRKCWNSLFKKKNRR